MARKRKKRVPKLQKVIKNANLVALDKAKSGARLIRGATQRVLNQALSAKNAVEIEIEDRLASTQSTADRKARDKVPSVVRKSQEAKAAADKAKAAPAKANRAALTDAQATSDFRAAGTKQRINSALQATTKAADRKDTIKQTGKTIVKRQLTSRMKSLLSKRVADVATTASKTVPKIGKAVKGAKKLRGSASTGAIGVMGGALAAFDAAKTIKNAPRGGPNNVSAQGNLRKFRNKVKGPSRGGRR